MQIFVSEYVCGGAWPGEQLNSSLAREGQAMLTALVEDLSEIPGARVVTTWDARLGECPLQRCDVWVMRSRVQEKATYEKLVHTSEVVWIVAPESDGILFQRRAICESLPIIQRVQRYRIIGANTWGISLCSDKKVFSEVFLHLEISTPHSSSFDPTQGANSINSWPLVVKPRDGAGSQNTFLVRTELDLWNVCRQLLKEVVDPDAFIQQPYVPGKALSVALLIAEDGSIIEVLPVAEQLLSDDGRFRYLGGRIPASISSDSTDAVKSFVQKVHRAIPVPGLTGYVGFDIVLPDDSPTEPVLIEINPRLTTSYLGYRLLTDDNIAARLIDPSTPPLRWKSEAVTFTV